MTQTFADHAKKIQAPFNLYTVQAGEVRLLVVVGPEIVETVSISEDDLLGQVERISGEITHWGVLGVKARRAWQQGELDYRIWREKLAATMLAPPSDPVQAKAWKRPTEAQVEAAYRSHPDYRAHQIRLAELEESCNGALAVLDGFRAKKDALKMSVRRSAEDAAPVLSV